MNQPLIIHRCAMIGTHTILTYSELYFFYVKVSNRVMVLRRVLVLCAKNANCLFAIVAQQCESQVFCGARAESMIDSNRLYETYSH